MMSATVAVRKRMAKKIGNAQIARQDTQHGQDQQRHGHHEGWLPYLVGMTRINPRRSPECDKHQTETVERRQAGRDHPQHGEQLSQRPCLPGGQQHGVFTEKSGSERKAGQRQRANHDSPAGHGHGRLQAAHVSHVLLMMDGQNDRPASQKQQRFKSPVGQQVIHPRHVPAQTTGHHHVPELTQG